MTDTNELLRCDATLAILKTFGFADFLCKSLHPHVFDGSQAQKPYRASTNRLLELLTLVSQIKAERQPMGRKEKKMKNTKLQAMIMAGAMAASSLSAMSVFADETTSEAATEAVSATEVDTEGKFVLEYPEDMQELGYTDPIVLDEVPERVVSLSAAPVLALYELGVNLVGIPNSMVVTLAGGSSGEHRNCFLLCYESGRF